ncbi:hypothetical protein OESDEN_02675 [Oesophagostomum dentatum]|uniref:Uncharacterized protein n=1 Tax=Oesophagostomum dentatum TaxID=61180 RepID=A0A0B1TPL6_OESDE|nr:hypothetical protein OESDEN_02675 [Oesophagostomum dentatum]
MLVQLLVVLLIISVSTLEAYSEEECKDHLQKKYCESGKAKGLCTDRKSAGMMKRRRKLGGVTSDAKMR